MPMRSQSVLRVSAISLAVGAVCLLGACALSPGGKSGNARVPEPAKPVDLGRYLGRWYEFARYENRFEKGCEAVTADYAAREDGLIDVTNSCRKNGVEGPLDVSKGRAKVVAGSDNAKLKVSFFGPFFVGNYWVLDHADDYSWSIVGEPGGRYLWILTREAKPAASVRDGLIGRVRALGYDTSMLRVTQHG
ncbi:Outer membrane lipoprotein Blc [Paraburkholderia kirstenboschensis]|uniref:lipocalin family protein n=1 Tax=Paraburkholderia kirstenboschensis TaxID=1245436 RepID=UPI000B223D6F|nr:lipocalin family protein [Paraburkholderia kirstenboschensis]CAD6546218.1 Outer membrane lipoprotein Blc [Paraburkholderia kirstenboschensis]